MISMRLERFRVERFRSVKDSGWLDTSEITSLIGTNESGKTNILIPLWKLNPAKDGEIEPIADYPRVEYNEIRAMPDPDKPIFIRADFELAQHLIEKLHMLTGAPQAQLKTVRVERNFAGSRFVSFPNATARTTVSKTEFVSTIAAGQTALGELVSLGPMDEVLRTTVVSTLKAISAEAGPLPAELDPAQIGLYQRRLEAHGTSELPESKVIPVLNGVGARVQALVDGLSAPLPQDNAAAVALVLKEMPTFVYYSTYGNLDSEIYLPHVIENLKRTDLGGKEAAKARTLKVLFQFVRLDAEEILELGKDLDLTKVPKPTSAQIDESAKRKKEREILLQSASTDLTTKFRDWWRQGTYRIRFQADGAHFRIWVSDDLRTEEIELEGRSTGLQWFLSFYLIFLHEAIVAHKGAILLLDEPGPSLHPLAQKDLSKFFENLASTNQIVFTTHSPFLIDPDHLDRVKAVFVDEAGKTAVSSDLRLNRLTAQGKSIYSVHAALGLTVSDTLLQGCQPIIVEGESDQVLLTAIKNHLIAEGKLTPAREIVFVPAGGTKGAKAVIAIVCGKDEELPVVLLDSDKAGLEMAKTLRESTYKASPTRVLEIGTFVGFADAELEDCVDPKILAPIVDRYLRGPDDYPFADATQSGPIVPQIEAYAAKHSIKLTTPGWKVELAKLVAYSGRRERCDRFIVNAPIGAS